MMSRPIRSQHSWNGPETGSKLDAAPHFTINMGLPTFKEVKCGFITLLFQSQLIMSTLCTQLVMSEVHSEKDIARQMVVSVQQQQQRDKQSEDKIQQTNIFISQVEKIIKEAEVYSKVERLFIKEQNRQVVEGRNKQMASSGKQLICLKKDKISLRNQLYEIKNSYGGLISMEPVECPPPPTQYPHSKGCLDSFGLGYFRYL